MRNYRHAKAIAKTLRESLTADGIAISHGRSLELVAAVFGARDWNTLSAAIKNRRAVRFERAIPVLRVFDQVKVEEFYLNFLGFKVDWDHQFEPNLPYYGQISRSDLIIHLSEHHGDGTPGSVVFLPMNGIQAFHAELAGRDYGFGRPAVESEPWGLSLTVNDPFGNELRFCEYTLGDDSGSDAGSDAGP